MNDKIKLLTWNDANMEFFGGKLSYQSLMYKARRGYIPSIKIGRRIFFEESALKEFFRSKSVLMPTVAETSTQKMKPVNVPGIKKIA